MIGAFLQKGLTFYPYFRYSDAYLFCQSVGYSCNITKKGTCVKDASYKQKQKPTHLAAGVFDPSLLLRSLYMACLILTIAGFRSFLIQNDKYATLYQRG